VVDFDNAFIRGVFLNEIKNRFLCNVGINGKETICYIPSSCRLSNFLDLSGREVLLKPVAAKNSRTEFAVYAVRNKKNYILLNLSEANQIIEAQLHSRRFSFLGKRSRVQHERIIGSYKADLFIAFCGAQRPLVRCQRSLSGGIGRLCQSTVCGLITTV